MQVRRSEEHILGEPTFWFPFVNVFTLLSGLFKRRWRVFLLLNSHFEPWIQAAAHTQRIKETPEERDTTNIACQLRISSLTYCNICVPLSCPAVEDDMWVAQLYPDKVSPAFPFCYTTPVLRVYNISPSWLG